MTKLLASRDNKITKAVLSMARQHTISNAGTRCNEVTEMFQVVCQIMQGNWPSHIQLHLIKVPKKEHGTAVPHPVCKNPSAESPPKRLNEHHFLRHHSCHWQTVYTSEMACVLVNTRNMVRNQSTAVLTVKLVCTYTGTSKVTTQISTSDLIPGVTHVYKLTTSNIRL